MIQDPIAKAADRLHEQRTMSSLSLYDLERLAENDLGHRSKEQLLEYIGFMWCIIQPLDPEFRAELFRDYMIYQQKKETTNA